jgi:cellulose synthase/poly-beta-1,6-N-acetylglucosamine synthase-like glycosyltransferase
MTALTAVAPGRHRRHTVVLPETPTDFEKTSYAWRSLPFLTTSLTLSAACVIAAQLLFEIRNLIALPFFAYTGLFLLYQLVSLPVNFGGRSFDLDKHLLRVAAWRPPRMPTVDIFLPICGEPIAVLRNTWLGVLELLDAYPGTATAFVLDDGQESAGPRGLAAEFGFTYIRRPNPGYHKKSGNLAFALGRTAGDHVVIFDADFRSRADFLAETLPYMDDPTVGLVQTPQYFRSSKHQTWVERAAGATLEVFYRTVQVSRDRFGSALCVGSNAVYRRSALEDAGGFTDIPYAEDSHTGLDVRNVGYQLVYLPIVLAAGVCPSAIDSFMRQQYRWCCGATSLIWTRHMWRVRMRLTARLPYIAGWLWNLTTALRTVILPLIPITLLALLPGEVRLQNAVLLIPALVISAVLYPLWHNVRWTIHVWPLAIAVGWAQTLAIWDYARGKVMSWTPSRGPMDASRRFRKAVCAWNGVLGIAWVVLAGWRIEQSGSSRFVIIAALGLVNLAVVARVVFPGRDAM